MPPRRGRLSPITTSSHPVPPILPPSGHTECRPQRAGQGLHPALRPGGKGSKQNRGYHAASHKLHLPAKLVGRPPVHARDHLGHVHECPAEKLAARQEVCHIQRVQYVLLRQERILDGRQDALHFVHPQPIRQTHHVQRRLGARKPTMDTQALLPSKRPIVAIVEQRVHVGVRGVRDSDVGLSRLSEPRRPHDGKVLGPGREHNPVDRESRPRVQLEDSIGKGRVGRRWDPGGEPGMWRPQQCRTPDRVPRPPRYQSLGRIETHAQGRRCIAPLGTQIALRDGPIRHVERIHQPVHGDGGRHCPLGHGSGGSGRRGCFLVEHPDVG